MVFKLVSNMKQTKSGLRWHSPPLHTFMKEPAYKI